MLAGDRLCVSICFIDLPSQAGREFLKICLFFCLILIKQRIAQFLWPEELILQRVHKKKIIFFIEKHEIVLTAP
ncbi:hypothetical protein CA948_04025 [Alcaligenes aquatilis]|nr:hypothetical protein CA948_04025 [Alcaligenes aquatilis]